VKDIAMSKQFYQKLGFAVAGDDEAQNWLKNYGHRLEKRFAHHS
jgi:predicted lactoylglutathione lyase